MPRYTLLFALSAAVLAAGTSLAIGSQSMQLLGTRQVAAQKADRLPAALLVAGQSVLDQRDGQIADSIGTLSPLVLALRRVIGTAKRCISRPVSTTGCGRVCGQGRSA